VGIYRPSEATYYLRNSNSPGEADTAVSVGQKGDLPIVGDWDANGTTTVGIFRPSNQTFYLRNDNVSGDATIAFGFGTKGDLPIVGSWKVP
jgi:hypothetical protein